MRDFNSTNNSANQSQNNEGAMNMLKNFAQKYEGASQKDLINAIISEAEKGKRNGTLTNAEIDNFASLIKPMLSGAQSKQLESVIEKIKKL